MATATYPVAVVAGQGDRGVTDVEAHAAPNGAGNASSWFWLNRSADQRLDGDEQPQGHDDRR